VPFIALLCYVLAALLALIGAVGGDLGTLNLGYAILGLLALGLALDRGYAVVSSKRT
jgi:hypothetical protein